MMIRKPDAPYYVVVFTSKRNQQNASEYDEVSEQMVTLAKDQPGFLGIESARRTDGVGITVSYWQSEESIRNWKVNSDHQQAQKSGRESWYDWYKVQICKVEREYSFGDSE